SGNSWKQINKGLNSLVVYDIDIDRDYPKEMYVSSDVGVYAKSNIDEAWEKFGDNLEGIAVKVLMQSMKEEKFFAGTDQKGLTKNVSFPTVPVPMKPKNNQRITSLRPTLLWTETTEVTIPYTFAIRILGENKEIVYDKKNISGDQFIIPSNVLKRFKKYSWIVKAEAYQGDTNWSKEYYFTIITRIALKINEPLMTVNSKIQEIDPGRRTVPVIENGRTFLPISSLIGALDGEITWNQEKRKIGILFQGVSIGLQIGSSVAFIDGKETRIENDNDKVVPFIKNSRTMLPLRFIAETLAINIEWDQKTKTITLEYPG
ncbi:MAG: hypothetical protein KAH01_01455, partial [Caldisericia bacterium]|nr:hypothetical protein [Caldisericia bacterium]